MVSGEAGQNTFLIRTKDTFYSIGIDFRANAATLLPNSSNVLLAPFLPLDRQNCEKSLVATRQNCEKSLVATGGLKKANHWRI